MFRLGIVVVKLLSQVQLFDPMGVTSLTNSWSLLRFMSIELALCIRWPKYWNFSFSISPSDEYLGLISFRIDWFELLALQGTLKSLLQHHSS